MKMGKNWLQLAVLLTVSIGCLFGCNFGTGIIGTLSAGESAPKRADLIKIDSMAAFGRLEKAPVEFLHDAHTKALASKNLDCSACHLTKNNRIYPKFKRFEDTDRKEVMNIYHNGCIACHGEMNLAKEKTGPTDCADCHTAKEKYLSSRQAMGFDKSLHFAHSKNADNKCEKCHHAFNEDKKELFYDKGKEGTCRHCHEQKTQDNRISMRQASHLGCINCHLNTTVTQQVNPPLTCAGCHDPVEQQKFKKRADIPRMERNQPDIVLLKSASKSSKADEKKNLMNLVPFDHKAHEASNDNCRVCHHKSMQACGECHTPGGSTKGSSGAAAPNLENAMHKADSTRSCQGCHNAGKQDKNCAGCHAPMWQTRETQKEACLKCHLVPVANLPKTSTPEQETSLARLALQSTKRATATHLKEGIPEIVTIQRLSEQYEAVKLPHRQIINALMDRMKDNRLSGFFHDEKDAICQGCHHHSPASDKPPQCVNCHGKQWDVKTSSMPGILAAYHLQCMGCHKQMNIEKPAECIACHELKKLG
jgi:mono/diheme cytochrome c family protein